MGKTSRKKTMYEVHTYVLRFGRQDGRERAQPEHIPLTRLSARRSTDVQRKLIITSSYCAPTNLLFFYILDDIADDDPAGWVQKKQQHPHHYGDTAMLERKVRK
ncbi:uncharacterized protein SPSK_10727 [Sporothrix schenckii 1099-18]|uniref:Uncharacterized protein n=1 Tax=Sporothrix schenckii 1099-18 TaxID=1397361 RepID=A0A0F2MN85_SPOSC|nr:uncharacterized protein SPSK_10727 [Sporothrix schenckii 1099-18]KJR89641.1 hypothetical protein SPSK_10727 [Sporothrix schenckii 1099-18]